nr:MFS transporter [uncultured Holophaga sp.]
MSVQSEKAPSGLSVPAGSGARTLGVFVAGLCAFLGLYLTQPLLPELGRVFHAGRAAVSLTLTGSTLGVALAAPLVGSLADRLGRKRVIVSSAALLALATLLDASSRSLVSLVLWRFVQGLATPGVFAVTIAYIQEEWAGQGAGTATAIYVTGTVLGGFLGRMLGGLALEAWGWHAPFLLVGGLAGLGALLIHLLLPREARFVRLGSAPVGPKAHFRNRPLVATFAVGFCVLFCLVATFTYVTFHLSETPFRLGPVGLGLLFCTYLFGAVVTPPCGRIIDRKGHRFALGVAMGVGAVGLLLTLLPLLWGVVAGLALGCSGVFVAQATATSYIGRVTETGKAQAVGLYVTCYYLGGSVGSALPGLLWPRGNWPLTVALVILVQGLTLLLGYRYWRG